MVHYDPSEPGWSTNPGPLFDRIRDENPIHFAPGGYWVVSRHADALAILRHKGASSDAMNGDPAKQPQNLRKDSRARQYEEIRATGVDTRPFLFRDAPDHTRLRGLVQRAFTPRRVNELRPFIESKTADIIAERFAEAPRLQKVALHIDDDQRGFVGGEGIGKRQRVGDHGHQWRPSM